MAKRYLHRQAGGDPVSQKLLQSMASPALRGPATAAVPAFQPEPQQPPAERRSREKRVLMTPSEEHRIEQLVQRLAQRLGATVKLSHVLRASIKVLERAEREVLMQAQAGLLGDRPANGDQEALDRFEEQLADLLARAYREVSRPRAGSADD